MNKRIILIGSGVSSSDIAAALSQHKLLESDVEMVQADSDRGRDLIAHAEREIQKSVERFEIKLNEVAALKYNVKERYADYNRREQKGGKKNKRNWRY